MDSMSSSGETGRNHPGVVDNEDVAGSKIGVDMPEKAVLHAGPFPQNDHHAGGVPLVQRGLCNSCRRKVVIEIGQPHSHRPR